ncbi:restriction endonuclease subunit S [Lactobacillus johnsonii]|uniref:restriction endonuclease subunit S n=1 Tax=Lactobacillus johnsonii TaxID=33959 RepID=UPI000B9832D0|nr:restriction endonuclease subunit S [Lactobacillus johnsonii]OYS05110.1 hypothetical protein CBF54_03630 [Lactobacillus johnsonii]
MSIKKLTDVASIKYGYAFNSKNFTNDSSYPQIVRIRDIKKGFSKTYYNGEFKDEYIIHRGDLLLGMDGEFNIEPWRSEKALLNQRVCKVEAKEGIDKNYLYFALNIELKKIEKKTSFATVKHLSANVLNNIELKIPNFNEQIKISHILANILKSIDLKEKMTNQLDELIKARFVEMFGDPVIGQKFKDKYSMTEVCQIIDGDRGKNYPHNDDFSNSGYCLFLNAKNVTAKGFNFENQMYISQKKDSELKKGKLRRGDIVLTTRGTIGNLAFYDSEIPFKNIRINSGMVIIRLDTNRINEMFFIEQFKMQLFKVKQKIASGTAQPQLPISTMNNIKILLPPISLQNEFANFVQQVDKSKFENIVYLNKTLSSKILSQIGDVIRD